MAGIREVATGYTEFVEEGVYQSFNGRKTLSRCILKKSRDQIDCLGTSLAEYL